ncbi:MAG: hypothetical protein QM500_14545 [Methylococcales bacterium]
MHGLTQDIKRMLSALAYQDASEFLSSTEKLKILNADVKVLKKCTGKLIKPTVEIPIVTIIFDGNISETLVNYVLNNSTYLENTKFDILAYGDAENLSKQTDILHQRLINAGKSVSVTTLMGDAFALFKKYIKLNHFLRCVIATEQDLLVRQLTLISNHHHLVMQLPLILIHDSSYSK